MKNVKLVGDLKTIVATLSVKQLNELFNQPDLITFTGVRDYMFMLLLDLFSEEVKDKHRNFSLLNNLKKRYFKIEIICRKRY
ncbi:hypothetical protein ACSVDA_21255 [Cytobacillus sp. Hm23]